MKANTILLILISFITISCIDKSTSRKEELFKRKVPIENINKKIRLSPWEPKKPRIGEPIDLILDNKSSNIITFTRDYGLKIFTYEYDIEEWMTIENELIYTPNENILLFPKSINKYKSREIVDLSPVIHDKEKPIFIRIVVIGNVINNGEITAEQVAAFTDILVSP